VVHAIGERVLSAVVGDDGLGLTALHREVRSTVEESARIPVSDVPA
jgi:hypothetical protein